MGEGLIIDCHEDTYFYVREVQELEKWSSILKANEHGS
jgi:hypothetical protein